MATLARILVAFVVAVSLSACAALVDSTAERREAAWQAQTPPLGRLLTLEGRQVHVYDAGRPYPGARDLVLIHGANGNLRDFTFDLVGRLERDFRVIAVDRPGLGWSDSWGEADSDPREQARILRLALAQLGVQRPIVVGHSYGGAVAMGWALDARDQSARDQPAALVLLAGATHPWDGRLNTWYRLNASALGTSARATVTAFASQGMVAMVLASVFEPASVPEGYAAYFGTTLSLRRASQANNTRQVNALLGYVTQMQPRYASLTLPIEIVHGDADTIVGLETHARRLAAEAPGAALTVIAGAGHMLHHSHPDVVVAAIHRAAARARQVAY